MEVLRATPRGTSSSTQELYMTMTVEQRIAIEKRIVARLIHDLTAAGHVLAHRDDWDKLTRVTEENFSSVLFTTDEDDILVFPANMEIPEENTGDLSVDRVGWIFLVYGNDGWDVINDYTSKLEPLLAGVFELVDQLEKEITDATE
jgi:hypothetical protein